MNVVENVKRRHFLIGSAGTVAAATVGVPAVAQNSEDLLHDYVAWKNAEEMIVHSKQTFETKRAAQGAELITPSRELYIRNNLPAPSDEIVADRDAWKVEIDGVANPGTMPVLPALFQRDGVARLHRWARRPDPAGWRRLICKKPKFTKLPLID